MFENKIENLDLFMKLVSNNKELENDKELENLKIQLANNRLIENDKIILVKIAAMINDFIRKMYNEKEEVKEEKYGIKVIKDTNSFAVYKKDENGKYKKQLDLKRGEEEDELKITLFIIQNIYFYDLNNNIMKYELEEIEDYIQQAQKKVGAK